MIAFITGISGQDGSYLAEFLLNKNYIVYGLVRRSSSNNNQRIKHITNPNLKLEYGDMTDGSSLVKILNKIKQQHEKMDRLEIYNLAAQSHVKISFDMPEYTLETDGVGTLKLLESVITANLKDKTRFYQASTSELYGKVMEVPQKETTPFNPQSPYAVAKLYSYYIVKNYREAYNMFACNGILFNHGGIRRGSDFIERKITLGLGKILKNESEKLYLGNLNSMRDLGSAKEYVEGIWKILQAEDPDDFVIATGKMYSIREIVEISFAYRGFHIKWKGSGIEEIGYDNNTGRELIFVDEIYFRPSEVEQLLGDSTKLKNTLGWVPKITIHEILKEMVDHDCP